MITPEDIDNLAKLSRLSLSDEEKISYTKDLNSIIDYVAEIQKLGVENSFSFDEKTINTFRDDIVTNETGSCTEVLIKAAPEHQDGFVKVKKILS